MLQVSPALPLVCCLVLSPALASAIMCLCVYTAPMCTTVCIGFCHRFVYQRALTHRSRRISDACARISPIFSIFFVCLLSCADLARVHLPCPLFFAFPQHHNHCCRGSSRMVWGVRFPLPPLTTHYFSAPSQREKKQTRVKEAQQAHTTKHSHACGRARYTAVCRPIHLALLHGVWHFVLKGTPLSPALPSAASTTDVVAGAALRLRIGTQCSLVHTDISAHTRFCAWVSACACAIGGGE